MASLTHFVNGLVGPSVRLRIGPKIGLFLPTNPSTPEQPLTTPKQPLNTPKQPLTTIRPLVV